MTYLKLDVEELWVRLASEGNFILINKLHRAERLELGYGTITVTREGFSEDDTTHNMVLHFLKERNIHILNPGLEEARLEYALRSVNGKGK